MNTLNDRVFLGYSRLEFCHEPPTVGGSRSSLPLAPLYKPVPVTRHLVLVTIVGPAGPYGRSQFSSKPFFFVLGTAGNRRMGEIDGAILSGTWPFCRYSSWKLESHRGSPYVSFALPTFLTSQWLPSAVCLQNLLVQLLLHFPHSLMLPQIVSKYNLSLPSSLPHQPLHLTLPLP